MKFNRIFFIVLFSVIAICIAYANFGIKEMDNLKVWNNAYNDLSSKTSYTLQEDVELKYTLNDNEFKRVNTHIINLKQLPYLQKNVNYTVNDDYITEVPETIFFLEEDNSLYYIHKINTFNVKNELDYYNFYNDDSVDPFSLIFNHIPLYMVKSEDNKYEYTYTFKLSQYQKEYQTIFDDLVAELSEEFKTKDEVNIIDQELKLKILFNEKYQYSSISLDLTNILKDIVDDTYSNIINEYGLVINYTFSNYDDVKIDEEEYNDAILDNAPNEVDSIYSYPVFETASENQGKFEYENDVDIYDLSIPFSVKYEFKISTDVDINFYLLDESNKILINDSYLENESYVINLQPGEYHLFIENNESDTADYTINTVIKSNDSEIAYK
jgi:hypothetical protein